MSQKGGEVLTVSVGPAANWTAAHLWNLQKPLVKSAAFAEVSAEGFDASAEDEDLSVCFSTGSDKRSVPMPRWLSLVSSRVPRRC